MPKAVSEKCPNCKYRSAPLAMYRLYIKHLKKWKAVGWLCTKCGYIKLVN